MIKQEEINKHRHSLIPNQNLLIGKNWVSSKSGKTQSIISPIDGKIISELQVANNLDVNEAVLSAREVFDKGHWSNMPPLNRKKIMLRIAEIIEEKILELTVLGVRDNGTEFNMALRAEPGSAAGTFRYYAEAIDKIYGEVSNTSSDFIGLIQKEPVGVVAAIVPWNFPLMIGAWKIAPALAMGNSVIIKPSEAASLSLLKLGEICLEAGLPPGTLNIVTGNGKQTGQALARHMDVDVLTFTGSGNTGRQLLEYSAQSNMKRIYQELGGKSPNIILSLPLDPVTSAAAFAEARDTGVSLVFLSNLPSDYNHPDDYAAIVTDDLFQMGKQAADALAKSIGGKGTVGWIYHDAAYYVTNQRDNGFKATIENDYPNIEIVSEQGLADPARAEEIANAMLVQNPDISGIYAPWAGPAEGVLAALRSNGNTTTKLVTLDLSEPIALDMVSGGNVAAIVADEAYELGRAMAAAGVLKYEGESVPEFIIVPAITVTSENVSEGWKQSLNIEAPASVLK